MTLNRQILAGVALALLAASAQAGWKGKGEAGIVFARGNTNADTINFKLAMSEEVDRWKHSLEMSALRATSGGVRSACHPPSDRRHDSSWGFRPSRRAHASPA